MAHDSRGMRLGITSDWSAKWYASSKEYSKILNSDLLARLYLEKHLKPAGVSNILIERDANDLAIPKIKVYVARPGLVIGKKGDLAERVKNKLQSIMGAPVYLSIQEIARPELDAKLIAENIANQLVRRMNHKRAMKKVISTAMRSGALGIKIKVSGRLGGVEIARNECYTEGSVPLNTLRAHIDDGYAVAHTGSGAVGVTVFIHCSPDMLKRDVNKKSGNRKVMGRKNYSEARRTSRN